jgi:hypothetical protein
VQVKDNVTYIGGFNMLHHITADNKVSGSGKVVDAPNGWVVVTGADAVKPS